MLEIHRTIGNPDWATRLRSRWEKMKAQVVGTRAEAEAVAIRGGLVVLDHTNNGQDVEETSFRDRKPTYETRYVEPKIDHFCDHTKAWFELRFKTAVNAISVDTGYEEGPYWARMVKNGFIDSTRHELETAQPGQECGCDKDAKMKAIRRIVGLDPVGQNDIDSRIKIDSRYADLQSLLDLNPDPPREPVIISS